MNIFDNLVKDTEIVGIGALNSNDSPEQNTISYSFKVLTRQNSLTIYSPVFKYDETKQIDAWLKIYLLTREKISEQIGELQVIS